MSESRENNSYEFDNILSLILNMYWSSILTKSATDIDGKYNDAMNLIALLKKSDLDESKEYSLEDIKEFIDNLKERHIISEVEADSVNTNLLYRYTKSVLWQEIKQAKEVHKEQPFYVNIPAKKIYDEAEENEMILVQGIIDLYFIDKEGKLVLVDYKTDYVENGNVAKLEEKYKVQLDLYKEALEKTLNRKVDRAMIWALNA